MLRSHLSVRPRARPGPWRGVDLRLRMLWTNVVSRDSPFEKRGRLKTGECYELMWFRGTRLSRRISPNGLWVDLIRVGVRSPSCEICHVSGRLRCGCGPTSSCAGYGQRRGGKRIRTEEFPVIVGGDRLRALEWLPTLRMETGEEDRGERGRERRTRRKGKLEL